MLLGQNSVGHKVYDLSPLMWLSPKATTITIFLCVFPDTLHKNARMNVYTYMNILK